MGYKHVLYEPDRETRIAPVQITAQTASSSWISSARATRNETRYGGLSRGARRDAEESMLAFRERRKPHYEGR